jgi:hypothetical protein
MHGSTSSLSRIIRRLPLPTLYVLVGILAVALTALIAIISRIRKAPSFDQVPQNVLNRIRTEYR